MRIDVVSVKTTFDGHIGVDH